MYPVERQREILNRARVDGRVEVLELSSRLDVAPETIRATWPSSSGRECCGACTAARFRWRAPASKTPSRCAVPMRASRKKLIAAAALGIVTDVDSVYFDEGSTVAALADLLRAERELTVVTSSLPVATMLSARANVNVLILGGRVRGRTSGVADHWAVQMLSGMVIDVAFIGCRPL